MTATEVESLLRETEDVLLQVARLIETRTPLASWPAGCVTSLLLALSPEDEGLAEAWKTTALRRHLFGPRGGSPRSAGWPMVRPATPAERRQAERLRSGLPALTRHRSGRYLLT